MLYATHLLPRGYFKTKKLNGCGQYCGSYRAEKTWIRLTLQAGRWAGGRTKWNQYIYIYTYTYIYISLTFDVYANAFLLAGGFALEFSSGTSWSDIWRLIVRRAGLLWSQQDFEWRWSVPLFKCLTVLEFSFILFDLCLLITFFNFIMNYVPIVTFWIFTYHKIWILSIMFCFIWSYWIIYFLACLEVSWRVVS